MTDASADPSCGGISGAPQYCGNASAEPAGCPTIGDVCDDGSLYAGDIDYGGGNEKIYVTDRHQSTSAQWKTSSGANDINPDSSTDGRANHTNRSGTLSDFPAFELCEDLHNTTPSQAHGQTDWYLPSDDEMDELWTNNAAIDANAFENFNNADYWTSTEFNTGFAYRYNTGSSSSSSSNKTFNGDTV